LAKKKLVNSFKKGELKKMKKVSLRERKIGEFLTIVN